MTFECCKRAQEKFQGKHVLLTGASGGLGRAFGLELARCGVRTLIISGRQETFLQHLAEECREISPSFMEVHCIPCDLSDPDDVMKLGQEALKLCNVNVLINNAGVSNQSPFLDTKLEVDQIVMQVNFMSGVSLAKMIVPSMVEGGSGTIVWISSVQGLYALPGRSSYVASKFAVQGYSEAIRAELASNNITVHVASPGLIKTKFSQSAIAPDGCTDIPLKSAPKIGASPESVAVSVLSAVAKGKNDFLVAASAKDRLSMLARFFVPSMWNRHLVKVYKESKKLEAEKAVQLQLEEETHNESKCEEDHDTISAADTHEEFKETTDIPDIDTRELTPEKSKSDDDSDSGSAESIGSQLARLAEAEAKSTRPTVISLLNRGPATPRKPL